MAERRRSPRSGVLVAAALLGAAALAGCGSSQEESGADLASANVNPGFRGFTGPLGVIVDIAGAVHVPIEKGEKLPSGGYEVRHGTPVLGVTADGRVPVVWTEGTSAAKLAEDIQVILTEGVPTIDEEAGS